MTSGSRDSSMHEGLMPSVPYNNQGGNIYAHRALIRIVFVAGNMTQILYVIPGPFRERYRRQAH